MTFQEPVPPLYPNATAATESARELSSDQTAVSERESYQPGTYSYPGNIGSIDVRLRGDDSSKSSDSRTKNQHENTLKLSPDSPHQKNSKNLNERSLNTGYAGIADDFRGFQHFERKSGIFESPGEIECVPEHEPLGNCEYGSDAVSEGLVNSERGDLQVSSDRVPEVEWLFNQLQETADWVPRIIKEYRVFVVGTGTVKDARCGRFKPLLDDTAGACPNKPNEHKPFVLPIGCKRRECPEDFTRWSHQQARRLSNVVNGYLRVKFKHQAALVPGFTPRYLPDHISIHPPRALVVELVRRTEKALQAAGIEKTDYHAGIEFHRIFQQKYNYEEKKALDLLGLKGCAAVYHPVRLRKDQEDRTADAMMDTGRYRAVLDQKTWIKGVKFSVHSHIVTDGSFLPSSEEFHENTGWTYRNHRFIADIENLAKYLLSHAGANPGRHSIRYLGDFQKLAIEGTMKIETFIPCPECLQEGTPASEASYVVGRLLGMEYHRDKDRHTRMTSWSWGEIYEKHYVKRVRLIPVFRLRSFGQPRKAVEKMNGKPLTLPYDTWSKLPKDLQDVSRWIIHFSQAEWMAFDKKPDWWV